MSINDAYNDQWDAIGILSEHNLPVGGIPIGGIHWSLLDHSKTALSSFALLSTAPVLSDWPLRQMNVVGNSEVQFNLMGKINAAEVGMGLYVPPTMEPCPQAFRSTRKTRKTRKTRRIPRIPAIQVVLAIRQYRDLLGRQGLRDRLALQARQARKDPRVFPVRRARKALKARQARWARPVRRAPRDHRERASPRALTWC